jgi:hypothetical protein
MHFSETFSFLRRKPAHLDLTFAAEIKKSTSNENKTKQEQGD